MILPAKAALTATGVVPFRWNSVDLPFGPLTTVTTRFSFGPPGSLPMWAVAEPPPIFDSAGQADGPLFGSFSVSSVQLLNGAPLKTMPRPKNVCTCFEAGGTEPSLVEPVRWTPRVIGFGFFAVPALDGDTVASSFCE